MRVTCTVNGEPRQADDVWPGESLLYVLRERLGLPGAKNACEQGECGSCTVYLDGLPVCACLVAAGQARAATWSPSRACADGERAATRCRRRSSRPARSNVDSARPGLIVAVHDLLARDPDAVRPGDPRGAGRQPVPLHRLREDHRSGPAGGGPIMIRHRELRGRHGGRRRHRVRRRARRRSATTAGSSRSGPGTPAGSTGRCAGSTAPAACSRPAWSTPTTTCTSGPPAGCAQDETLFELADRRCTRSGPASTRRSSRAAAAAGLGWLALSGCTTSTDHHYVFPRDGGDLLAAQVEAAAADRAALPPDPRLDGPRPSRHGGLPPDSVVEDTDAALAATEEAIDRFHDPSPGRDGAGRRRALLAVLGHRRS